MTECGPPLRMSLTGAVAVGGMAVGARAAQADAPLFDGAIPACLTVVETAALPAGRSEVSRRPYCYAGSDLCVVEGIVRQDAAVLRFDLSAHRPSGWYARPCQSLRHDPANGNVWPVPAAFAVDRAEVLLGPEGAQCERRTL